MVRRCTKEQRRSAFDVLLRRSTIEQWRSPFQRSRIGVVEYRTERPGPAASSGSTRLSPCHRPGGPKPSHHRHDEVGRDAQSMSGAGERNRTVVGSLASSAWRRCRANASFPFKYSVKVNTGINGGATSSVTLRCGRKGDVCIDLRGRDLVLSSPARAETRQSSWRWRTPSGSTYPQGIRCGSAACCMSVNGYECVCAAAVGPYGSGL